MTREELASALDEIGLLLELQGANPFKTRAYQSGARTVRALEVEPAAWIESGEMPKTRGIGKALSEKITTLVETGSLPYLDDLRGEVPEGLLEFELREGRAGDPPGIEFLLSSRDQRLQEWLIADDPSYGRKDFGPVEVEFRSASSSKDQAGRRRSPAHEPLSRTPFSTVPALLCHRRLDGSRVHRFPPAESCVGSCPPGESWSRLR